MEKKRLFGMTIDELRNVVADLAMPKFTATQIADWMYKKGAEDIEQITNLSAKNKALLSEHYEIGRRAPFSSVTSSDGTKKYLFQIGEKYIETVYIPDKERATLCVSCQVGCKMNCKFCMTGKQGFTQHLTTNEILNQIQSIPEFETLTNVVYMGMGEPMDNVDNILKSLEILTSDYGYAWSPKRITVSTVGLIPGMQRFLKESKCHLAVSLHNPFSEERLAMMPVEKAFKLEKVIEEIKKYDFTGQRRVSFEYTVFKGKNNLPRHAKMLASLLQGLECRINLIRFHTIPNVDLEGASDAEMLAFENLLKKNGLNATIRKSRGEDIFAACGLLSSERNKKNQE